MAHANALTPVTVSSLSDAVEVTAGTYHSCARRSSGAVVCWGYNVYGALGNGTAETALTPVAVSGLTDALHVGAGNHQSCAVRGTSTVVCWGDNTYGAIGNGTTTTAYVPTTVTGLPCPPSRAVAQPTRAAGSAPPGR